MRSSSEVSTRRRASAAIFRTVVTSIGMAQLREGREDLLRPPPAKLHGELGAFPDPFARDHDTLPELWMDDPDPDRAGPAPAGARGGRRRSGRRPPPRRGPEIALLDHHAVGRDLRKEPRHPPAAGVPRAAI